MKRAVKRGAWKAWLLMLVFLTAPAAAQDAPIKVIISASKLSFQPGEPVTLKVTVLNRTSDQSVITRAGFLTQEFHKMLTFYGPGNEVIRFKYQGGEIEPPPSKKFNGRPAALVKRVLPEEGTQTEIYDALDYYNLPYGRIEVDLSVALETFVASHLREETGELFAYIPDDRGAHYDPLVSNRLSFEVVPPETSVAGSVRTELSSLIIGGGVKPGVRKKTIDGDVILVRTSRIPAEWGPVSWKLYPLIAGLHPDFSVRTTGGVAEFGNVPQDDYVLLALVEGAADFKHLGSRIEAADPEWETGITRRLKMIEKANGEKLAGRTIKKKGSLLLITEPEFVTWDDTEESYPFVFETAGDWDVSTSVTLPEGFVADNDSLAAEVVNEVEAVQFTITDVGSRWEETEVEYVVSHKQKKEKIKSKIGVKLEKKFAKKKGLRVYGHTEPPPTIKGGRVTVEDRGREKTGNKKKKN